MRALAIMYAEEQYQAWGNVLHSVRTGETAFDQQFGMNYVGGDLFIEYRAAGTPICSPRFYMIGTMNGAWPFSASAAG